jgi:radical SAM superfamily enzyme YgiQ (UPF0313 family)
MRALLVSPQFPKNMWTYERALALIKRKSALPPLSLVTVAALLPEDWEFKLIDRNVRPATEAEWDWAEIVLISAMTTQKQHGYPFCFQTEASVDLADDPELLDLMSVCNFNSVFLGVETPDQASLTAAHKTQNTRRSLDEAVEKITRAGLCVMGGFIIGFDGEQPGTGERIYDFVERNSIPTTLFSMLQALPHTALWHRLRREGRLIGEDGRLNQDTLMNFIPTRPIQEVASEYVETTWKLYDPCRFMDRTYRHFLMLGLPRWHPSERIKVKHSWSDIRALLTMCWRQGVKRKTRWKYWHHLFSLLRRNPRVAGHYICVSAHIEHFLWYRQQTRHKIGALVAAGPV